MSQEQDNRTQCVFLTKTGQCKRMVRQQMADGRWLCKQHGGPASSPTCSHCNKNISKYDTQSLERGQCAWCYFQNNSQGILRAWQRAELQRLQQQATQQNPHTVSADEDPTN